MPRRRNIKGKGHPASHEGVAWHLIAPLESAEALVMPEVKRIIRWKKPPLKSAVLAITAVSLIIAVLAFGALTLQMTAGADPALGPKYRLLLAESKRRPVSLAKAPVVHKTKPQYTLVPTKPTPVPGAFNAQAGGSIQQSTASSGIEQVQLTLTIQGESLSALNITLDGTPDSSGSLQISSSNVTLGPDSNPTLYSGTITQVSGTSITATVSRSDGTSLSLSTVLQVSGSTASGTVSVAPVTTTNPKTPAPAPSPQTTTPTPTTTTPSAPPPTTTPSPQPQTTTPQAPAYVPAPVTTAVS